MYFLWSHAPLCLVSVTAVNSDNILRSNMSPTKLLYAHEHYLRSSGLIAPQIHKLEYIKSFISIAFGSTSVHEWQVHRRML